jgi:hypothetical protein
MIEKDGREGVGGWGEGRDGGALERVVTITGMKVGRGRHDESTKREKREEGGRGREVRGSLMVQCDGWRERRAVHERFEG